MKRVEFERPHNLSQLHDELLAQLEDQLIRVNEDGERVALHRVEGLEDTIILHLPDGMDTRAVATIVEAHTPQERPPDPLVQALEEVNAATTVTALRTATMKALRLMSGRQ